jgi:hypothetical protein
MTANADEIRTRWLELKKLCAIEPTGIPDELIVDRTYSPLQDIGRDVRLEDRPKVLLSGLMGSGKSTELRRLARALSEDRFVVYLDLGFALTNVFGDGGALTRITSWELCFLIAVQAMQQANERFGTPSHPVVPRDIVEGLESAWKLAAKEERTLDLASVGKALAVGAGSLLTATVNPVAGGAVASIGAASLDLFKGWFQIGASGRADYDAQAEESRHLLAAINRLFGFINDKHMPALVIVDGLDRMPKAERAQALLIESDMLSKLSAGLVLCAPFAPHRQRNANMVRGFERYRLLCEPVIDARTTSAVLIPDSRGLSVFREVFKRRAQRVQLEGALTAAQIDRLALYSGGRMRLFVAALNRLCMIGQDRGTATLGDEDVARVIDKLRRDCEESVDGKDLDVLRAVMTDPTHQIPSMDSAIALLQNELLLVYPNQSDWFFPHPLLTIAKLAKPE